MSILERSAGADVSNVSEHEPVNVFPNQVINPNAWTPNDRRNSSDNNDASESAFISLLTNDIKSNSDQEQIQKLSDEVQALQSKLNAQSEQLTNQSLQMEQHHFSRQNIQRKHVVG